MSPKEYKENSERLKLKRKQYKESNLNWANMSFIEHCELNLLRNEIKELDKNLKDYDKSLGQFFRSSIYNQNKGINEYNKG